MKLSEVEHPMQAWLSFNLCTNQLMSSATCLSKVSELTCRLVVTQYRSTCDGPVERIHLAQRSLNTITYTLHARRMTARAINYLTTNCR